MPADSMDSEFEIAYREWFPRAARLAYRLLGDREAAEDVAAETLARAYAHWPRIRVLGHRDRWVMRVATNLAIDAARHRTPTVDAPGALDSHEAATLRIALVEALKALPRRQRQAIVLCYLSGLREIDVARALGVSPGTTSTNLRRGLDALRHRLGDDFVKETLIT
jgi:RNA polymerase sigma factor (sigma-70 family)